MLYCMEIQHLILNTDSCMTTHDLPSSTLKIIYHHGGDHVVCGKSK